MWISPRTSTTTWHAGPWSVDVRGDELADIAYAGEPILRSIRAVIRDRDWNTPALLVERLVKDDDSLTLHLRSEGFGAAMRGLLRVQGEGPTLSVSVSLETLDPYWTNRTGLVALHPPSLAGAPLTIAHGDGTEETTCFPRDISPHQPAFDIAALAWRGERSEVLMRFDGDVFEMEDQRNWTDASFKSYNRPLSLPFPYLLEEGERVEQRIDVTVVPREASSVAEDSGTVALVPIRRPFPVLALGASSAPDPAPAVRPMAAAVLVEIDLASENWEAALTRAASSGAPLDVRVTAGAGQDFVELGRALGALPLVRIGVFDPQSHVTEVEALDALRRALASTGIRVPMVGGARSHFTELNREVARIPADLDAWTFATTPLFHSTSADQLIEALPIQRLVAEQAVRMASGRPVHIGPITLRPRFNNVATVRPSVPAGADLRAGYGAEFTGQTDGRQASGPLAAWLVASCAALAVPGVESLTYFEEWGPRGLVSAEGEPYPVYEAFTTLRGLSGRQVSSGWSADGLLWALEASGGPLVVANLDSVPRDIRVLGDARVDVRVAAGSWAAFDPDSRQAAGSGSAG